MATNDHGSCRLCGYDFNGELIYDHFLKTHTPDRAKELAEMYGASEGHGRFGKQIIVKHEHADGLKDTFTRCPNCGGEY